MKINCNIEQHELEDLGVEVSDSGAAFNIILDDESLIRVNVTKERLKRIALIINRLLK